MVHGKQTMFIYTDGACSGNPGPGGWGAIIKNENFFKEIRGGALETTNNRMELTAAIEALESLSKQYLVKKSSFLRTTCSREIKFLKVSRIHWGKILLLGLAI